MLILDGFANIAEIDTKEYTYSLMNLPNENFKDKEVLILGGGNTAYYLIFMYITYSDLSLNNSKSLDQTSGKTGNFRYIYCIPKSFFVNSPQNWLG